MEKCKMFNINKDATLYLKGLAILFVLLGHMGYIRNCGAWGVSLFLILSGYGTFKSYEKNNNIGFFRKKFIKVWLPYFLYQFL